MPPDTPWVERYFQNSYIGYTKAQEKVTPQFQRLMGRLREKYGNQASDIPADFRESFRQKSLPVIFWNGLLTFNFRSFWLFLFCLIDLPAMYFLFEIFAMGLLAWYVKHRHESFCREFADRL